MNRRDFLKSAPVGALLMHAVSNGQRVSPGTSAVARKLEAFDYQGVRLRPSRWQQQFDGGRAFYLGLSNDDILYGFRAAANQNAAGKPLGGWCGVDSSTTFGQWLSGMSRIASITGDAAMKEKALTLYAEWAKTIGPDGNARMNHYPFDKVVGGLVDIARYGGQRDAIGTLMQITAHADKMFQRPQAPMADITDNQGYYGRPQEWYTLSENLFRAYQLTGDATYRLFADVWLYKAYWDKFAKSSSPADAHGVHAYSHVNTFGGAAMAYEVTGDATYLDIIKNAYDYLQKYQCYATGGYGPNERFMKTDGSLGRALDTRSDTCEAVCGSWAGFKLSRHLMQLTGEARYGDWIERLFYNGVGAALPIAEGARNFYYADYRVGGGMKVYNWDTCTCCSGTYIQNIAEYHNLIYFRDTEGLFVNLFVPSEAEWTYGGRRVKVVQDTSYPDTDTTTVTFEAAPASPMSMRFRVPSWARTMTAKVNGSAVTLNATPGTWATIARTWRAGDKIELQIPHTLRMEAVDREHPDRVAVMRGPVVFVLEGAYHDPNFALPKTDAALVEWLVPEAGTLPRGVWSTGLPAATYPTSLRVTPPDKRPVRLRFRPFYEIGENYPYFMYFDRDKLPGKLW